MLIARPEIVARVQTGLKGSPVTALLGPRQCGKTTLARQFAGQKAGGYFDLENPRDQARLQNPQTALEGLSGLVVLDEIQRRPHLMPLLRVLADRRPVATTEGRNVCIRSKPVSRRRRSCCRWPGSGPASSTCAGERRPHFPFFPAQRPTHCAVAGWLLHCLRPHSNPCG
jgi:hypothetical protein